MEATSEVPGAGISGNLTSDSSVTPINASSAATPREIARTSIVSEFMCAPEPGPRSRSSDNGDSDPEISDLNPDLNPGPRHEPATGTPTGTGTGTGTETSDWAPLTGPP